MGRISISDLASFRSSTWNLSSQIARSSKLWLLSLVLFSQAIALSLGRAAAALTLRVSWLIQTLKFSTLGQVGTLIDSASLNLGRGSSSDSSALRVGEHLRALTVLSRSICLSASPQIGYLPVGQ